MSAEPFTRNAVRGFLDRPADPSGDILVLSHGAGSNARSPLLVRIGELFAGAGITVLRIDLPFRHARAGGPPLRGDAATDREGIRQALLAARDIRAGRLFFGGHSYGGRQSTILAASVPDIADGLMLLSYPLHPPKKPAELRTAHFPDLRLPCLFVHGSRDPFGSIEEMRAALELIPAKTELLLVEGAGHDLGKSLSLTCPHFLPFFGVL